MIRRIELNNFMSHGRTVIEPAAGLTVLVGPNNCGKSAVVAAMQILCHNETSTYVTRHNEKECSVTVETDDGHVIEWRRKNNSPRYTLNGELFDRLARGSVPERLHELLRLPKVSAEGNQEFDVHFGEQKSPVFLLDKPGSHAAQFFASSSDAASLVEMQKRHQQKMTDARKERNQLDVKAEKLAADLTALAATESIEVLVRDLESQHAAVAELDAQLDELERKRRELDESVRVSNRLHARAAAFETLAAPPTLDKETPFAELIALLEQTQDAFELQSDRALSLALLRNCPVLDETRPLAETIQHLMSGVSLSRRLEGECAAAAALAAPPLLSDVDSLTIAINELKTLLRATALAEAQLAICKSLAAAPVLENENALSIDTQALSRAERAACRVEAIHNHFQALSAAPDIADYTEIAAAIAELNLATKTWDQRNDDVENAAIAMQHCDSQLHAWAESNPFCPTCGGALDLSRIVVHARSCGGGNADA